MLEKQEGFDGKTEVCVCIKKNPQAKAHLIQLLNPKP